jgi:class 3 adenylate cyclase
MAADSDIAAVLPAIRVPTLVLHRIRDRLIAVEGGRYLAAHVAGAKYVELDGDDHLPWVGDSEALAQSVQDFIGDVDRETGVEPDRAVTTVLFTDIVASTEHAATLGDRRWSELLAAHNAAVRRELERWRGREVDARGDGFLASFDGPARAIRCALALRDAVHALGVEIRVGLHTGECELAGEKLEGIAVHTGGRVAALARAGEVLVSSTVKDLVAGSGIDFEDRGEHDLKGVPGSWRLYAVVRA